MLVDTSALVGIFMRDDDWHGPAVEAMEQLQASRKMMLTTSDVFGETLTALRRWAGHAQAVKVGDILRKSGLVKLVSIDDATREAAWKSDPLVKNIGFIARSRRKPGQSEDDVAYDRN